MNSLTTLSIVAIFLAASASQAAQETPTKVFQAHYDKSDHLFQKMDIDGLAKLILESHTSDFSAISRPDKAGKVVKRTIAQTVAGLKPSLQLMHSFEKVASHIDKVAGTSASPVLTVSTTIEATTKKLGDGKTHKLKIVSASEDTWVKEGLTWKIKSARVVSRNMTFDGNRMPDQ